MSGLRMIWPYLAVVIDSFRAAMASRVLWAAMLAIWVLLLALAPIGLREDYTTSFRWFDLYNGTRMKALLAQGLVDPKQQDAPVGRIAAAMPDELQRKLRSVGEGEEVRIPIEQLSNALNDLIEVAAQSPGESGWYDAAAWADTVRLRELRELDATPDDQLSDSLQRRRSRLRIEAALPGVFEARSARSVILTYAGFDFPTGLPIDRTQFESLFNQFVIPTLVHWLLGLVLVFLGVLVTASIIPDMLQPGSLHLLLSKPISRWALLNAKFAGGCAFVTLCVIQLVVGLVLIAGWRLGIWNPRILLCIPVSVFLFAVFFSVSVLAGLVWRSAIISIAAAGALAAICVVVAVIGGVFDARVVQTDRVVMLQVVGEDWIGVTGGSGLARYDRDANSWTELIPGEAMSRDRILPPISLDDETILTARIRGGRFNPFGSGASDLIVVKRDNDWAMVPSLRLPNATERLVRVPDQRILTVNAADLLLTTDENVLDAASLSAVTSGAESIGGPAPIERRSARGRDRAAPAASWLQSLLKLQGGATEDFRSILPPRFSLSPASRVVVIPGDSATSPATTGCGGLAVLSRDRLVRLRDPLGDDPPPSGDEAWPLQSQRDLDSVDSVSPIVLAASARHVVFSRGDGQLRVVRAADLGDVASVELPSDITPLSLMGLPVDEDDQSTDLATDSFVVQTLRGEVWSLTIDAAAIEETDRVTWNEALPVDAIESMAVDAESGTLLVAHDVDRLTAFAWRSAEGGPRFSKTSEHRPSLSRWRWVDYYLIGTLQWLTPRALELGDTASALVSGEEAFVIPQGESGVVEVARYETAGPLISCGVFIAVILMISGLIFTRSDY